MGYRCIRYSSRLLLLLAGLLVADVGSACPLCSSPTARKIRTLFFGDIFPEAALALLLPMILCGMALFIIPHIKAFQPTDPE